VQIAESLKSSFPADNLAIVSIAHSGSQIACVGFQSVSAKLTRLKIQAHKSAYIALTVTLKC